MDITPREINRSRFHQRASSMGQDTGRLNQSLQLDVNLNEVERRQWDLEKGANIEILNGAKPSIGQVQAVDSTQRINFFSTKQNLRGEGRPLIEIVSKDGADQMSPNHSWLSDIASTEAPKCHAD